MRGFLAIDRAALALCNSESEVVALMLMTRRQDSRWTRENPEPDIEVSRAYWTGPTGLSEWELRRFVDRLIKGGRARVTHPGDRKAARRIRLLVDVAAPSESPEPSPNPPRTHRQQETPGTFDSHEPSPNPPRTLPPEGLDSTLPPSTIDPVVEPIPPQASGGDPSLFNMLLPKAAPVETPKQEPAPKQAKGEKPAKAPKPPKADKPVTWGYAEAIKAWDEEFAAVFQHPYPWCWEGKGADGKKVKEWLSRAKIHSEEAVAPGLECLRRSFRAYFVAVKAGTAWPQGDAATTAVFTDKAATWFQTDPNARPHQPRTNGRPAMPSIAEILAEAEAYDLEHADVH